jgi:hypothetical protein
MSNVNKPRDVISLVGKDSKVAAIKPAPQSQVSASAQPVPTATSGRRPLFGK